MRLVVGKMTGSAGGRSWTQVHDFMPDEIEKARTRGRLVAVLAMGVGEEADQVEMVKMGREILARLHELYFGQDAGAPMELLRSALVGVGEEFAGVEVSACVFVNKYIYVGVVGRGGVWASVKQNQGFVAEVAAESDEPRMFSGRVVADMCLILGNERFWEKMSTDGLSGVAALAGRDMDEAVELLTEKSEGSLEGEAAAVIYVPEVAETEAETEVGEEIVEEEVLEEEKFRPDRNKDRAGLGKLWSWIGSRREIYLRRGDRDDQRRKTRYVGLGLLAALLLMVGVGQVVGEKKQGFETVREAEIGRIEQNFRDAVGMVDLNPEKSREILMAITGDVEKYKLEKKVDPRVVEVVSRWDEVWSKAQGIVKPNKTELVDLKLIREGMEAGAAAFADEKLYVLDSKGFRVVEVDIANGAGKVVGGGANMTGARLIAGYPGKVIVLSGAGVIETGVAEPRIKTDEILPKVVGMEMYGGNIYVLASEDKEIYRYAAKADGFGTGQSWLADGEEKGSLVGGYDITIDGSIWVIGSEGIGKFTRGVRESFEIAGLDKLWAAGAKIFTTEESENLYILDAGNDRVLVIGKNGKYVRQYVDEIYGGAKDLAVVEEVKKIFLVGGDKVWAVDL